MQQEFVGVISDTHGLLRPEAIAALQGASVILHAGDIGKPKVLETLRQVAPVLAIKGNVDTGDWAQAYEDQTVYEVLGRRVCLVHNIGQLEPRHEQEAEAVIYGHSHKPECRQRDGILFFNPGSAGPRRFSLPVCVGRLYFNGKSISGEIVKLPL